MNKGSGAFRIGWHMFTLHAMVIRIPGNQHQGPGSSGPLTPLLPLARQYRPSGKSRVSLPPPWTFSPQHLTSDSEWTLDEKVLNNAGAVL